MLDLNTYKVETKPDWCPGCGDFGVLNGVTKALAMLEIQPKNVLVVSGIGCSSNLPGFIKAYGFHSIHGRAVAVASGAKLANPELNVVVTGGDGDGYGIGMGHFVHAMRRNLDITYVVMNNQIYGLTTGQASPTSEKGHVTKSTPTGVIETPVNPIALALVTGATYVARGFSGDPNHMAEIIANGIKHKGFALVDVFSPCVTFNKKNTYEWFRERVYKLEEADHNTMNFEAAMRKAHEWGPKIPIGLFYKTERPTYEDEEPALKMGPLHKQPFPKAEDLKPILQTFF
ncbi:MAG: 2-oxoacid ferredoxin oxidoreductase [Thaumarchaeota archaeon]|nr:2-oxoacid ferredoxin oxidoreductase [Nitrososphaerota archaeon]